MTSSNVDAIAHLTGLTLDPETSIHINNIQNDQSQSDDVEQQQQHSSEEQHSTELQSTDPELVGPLFTLRAIVSSKEAGVIIGKEGKNVADIRKNAHVRAGVSKVIPGVHERILTISGSVPNVAKAYFLISEHLLDIQNTIAANSAANSGNPAPQPKNETSVRLLVPHQLMGAVIGKAGASIKEIQEASGAKLIISKGMLVNSTERTVEVVGLISSIQIAIHHMGERMFAEPDRANGVINYDPRVHVRMASKYPGDKNSLNQNYEPSGLFIPVRRNHNGRYSQSAKPRYPQMNSNNTTNSNYPRQFTPMSDDTKKEVEVISIPSDMVGCLIGKGGSSINNIRRISSAYISISKEMNSTTQERDFTITGTPESIKQALKLLYAQLEKEKKKRMEAAELGTIQTDVNPSEPAIAPAADE